MHAAGVRRDRLRSHAGPRQTFRSLLCCTSRIQHGAKRLFCFDMAWREILHWGHFQVECSIFYWAPEEVSVFAAIRNFLSVLIGELDEVSEHGRDQVSMMGVGRRQPGGI